MTDEIQPALTPEEWAEFLDPANKDWVEIAYANMSRHAAAATGLYGQPFGFTPEDVALLRRAAEVVEWYASQFALPEGREHDDAALRTVASKVAALLPPQ